MTSDADPGELPAALPGMPGFPGVPDRVTALPERTDLPYRRRLLVGATAAGDIVLRSALATVIAAAMAPPVLTAAVRRGASRREGERLQFYAELAAEQDVAKSFPAPRTLPRIRSRPPGPVTGRVGRQNVENIEFTSSFEAINPAMRTQWRTFERNNVVQAQYWRHGDGPRPTLCAIHGFGGASYLINGQFFALPSYYRSGYDVLLYTLPFHGRRAEKYSPFGGFGYFAYGLSGFAEAMAQAVHDFRSIMDHLHHAGVDRIALTGVSLGGYTAALIASVDDRLEAVIPNCPVVTPGAALDEWFPANKLVTFGLNNGDISREALAAALSYHCPLNYAPLVSPERRLIITGLGDRFAPPQQAEMLWEHWDRCALHWFPGSHLMHVRKLEYLHATTRLLQGVMFG